MLQERHSMKKAYGFPFMDVGNYDDYGKFDVLGFCISEDGEFLGQHISSNLSYLKFDLETKTKGNYEYIFLDQVPDSFIELFQKSINDYFSKENQNEN